ncbi:unnamed protein product [Angiostrongylus costaricensis]|uniref:Uncharacterized protein n=1 Tax=Angiostrongylus costaricensis TaxID=334426 RepID=A0A158PLX0_ANGCS|nr:unnamed protein product [Angiostrongylus costaricensis]
MLNRVTPSEASGVTSCAPDPIIPREKTAKWLDTKAKTKRRGEQQWHHGVRMPHSRRWLTEEDLARHEGEDATSRRTTSMDHRLGSPALRKTKTSKR